MSFLRHSVFQGKSNNSSGKVKKAIAIYQDPTPVQLTQKILSPTLQRLRSNKENIGHFKNQLEKSLKPVGNISIESFSIQKANKIVLPKSKKHLQLDLALMLTIPTENSECPSTPLRMVPIPSCVDEMQKIGPGQTLLINKRELKTSHPSQNHTPFAPETEGLTSHHLAY